MNITVKSIVEEGDYGIEDTIAVLTDEEGNEVKVNMIQKWPVKRATVSYTHLDVYKRQVKDLEICSRSESES